MNIFILHEHPEKAAAAQCDRHVTKMLLESTQMLCLALPANLSPYKQAYQNHPCSKWALESYDNYKWLMHHAYALCIEYSYRYNKDHACHSVLNQLYVYFQKRLTLPQKGLTPFAQAMPDQYKDSDPVKAYRNYYLEDKAAFAAWNHRRLPPEWWMNKYELAIESLNQGKQHSFKAYGTSMMPLINDGSELTFAKTDDYQAGDVVLVKVKGRWMTHKLAKIDAKGRYLITNNKGHENGWTKTIYGRVVAVNGRPFGRKIK